MTIQNATKFIDRVGTDNEIGAQVRKLKKTVEAWIAAASKIGYDFSADELRAAAERRVGRALSLEDCVKAVSDALSELSLDALDGVAGGFAFSPNLASNLGALTGPVGGSPSGAGGDVFIKDSGPTWVNSPRNFGGGSVLPG
jgi:predicted ribosomally synthesized peptide with nif11-like leader